MNKKPLLDFLDHIYDVEENIIAIHGEKTAEFIRIQGNLMALLRLMVAIASTHEDGDDALCIAERICKLIAEQTANLIDMPDQTRRDMNALLTDIAERMFTAEQEAFK